VSAKKPVFLITGADLAAAALALLNDYQIVYAGKAPTDADIVGLCQQHDPVAIIVRYGKVGAAAMDAAPSLKVISKHGSGTDTIDKQAAAARGVEVVAAVGANAAAVAEHALALLLACAKSVVPLNARMHEGHWDKATHKSVELEGRTVGVIGLGAIGLRFARVADAMGMRVLGYGPYAKDVPGYIERADLDGVETCVEQLLDERDARGRADRRLLVLQPVARAHLDDVNSVVHRNLKPARPRRAQRLPARYRRPCI